MIKASLSGPQDGPGRETYVLGTEKCGSCGSRGCGGSCSTDADMNSSIFRAASMGAPWYESYGNGGAPPAIQRKFAIGAPPPQGRGYEGGPETYDRPRG